MTRRQRRNAKTKSIKALVTEFWKHGYITDWYLFKHGLSKPLPKRLGKLQYSDQRYCHERDIPF